MPLTPVNGGHEWSREEDRAANRQLLVTAGEVSLESCGDCSCLDQPDRVAQIGRNVVSTIARAEQLIAEKKIVSGWPVVGRIALRFMVEAESLGQVDQLVSSLPLWPLVETRVTLLLPFSERRQDVQMPLKRLGDCP